MARIGGPGNINLDYTNNLLTIQDGSGNSLGVISKTTGSGTFVCNGATPVTVADANYTLGDDILITLQVVGGTVGALPAVKTVTTNVGFTVAGTASDTSTYRYRIVDNS